MRDCDVGLWLLRCGAGDDGGAASILVLSLSGPAPSPSLLSHGPGMFIPLISSQSLVQGDVMPWRR